MGAAPAAGGKGNARPKPKAKPKGKGKGGKPSANEAASGSGDPVNHENQQQPEAETTPLQRAKALSKVSVANLQSISSFNLGTLVNLKKRCYTKMGNQSI